MKTMTEFIMEQEAPQVVEESFNEADLVSQFMALQAASANMSCILEFATIAEFCNENEIKMPESLVQEGFADVMDKIFTGIANFFQKIVDWFKGLVKGASATFSKSKITELIAKLKSSNFEGGNLSKEISDKIKYVNATYKIVWNFFVWFKDTLVNFKDAVKDADEVKDNDYQTLHDGLDSFITELKVFETESKWYRQDGTVDSEAFKGIASTSSTVNMKALPAQVPVDEAIKILENINKFNIPKQCDKLYKEIDVVSKEFAAIKTMEREVPKDPKNPDGDKVKETYQGYSKNASDIKALKQRIDKCAKGIATAYEKVTSKLTDVYAKAFKDLSAPTDKADKETYNKDLENAKKDTGRGSLKDKDATGLT